MAAQGKVQPIHNSAFTRTSEIDLEALVSAMWKRCEERGSNGKPLAQRAVARESGLSTSTVSQLLNGLRVPDVSNIYKACAWLGHPISRYFKNSDIQAQMAEKPTLEVIKELFDRDVAAGVISQSDRLMIEEVFTASYVAVLKRLKLKSKKSGALAEGAPCH